jgi:hypothetical protein
VEQFSVPTLGRQALGRQSAHPQLKRLHGLQSHQSNVGSISSVAVLNP